MADFLTIDVYRDPVRETPARRRSIRAALAARPEGLRAHTINYANTGTFTLIPRHVGTCLLLAWESSDAAHTASHGKLGAALGHARDYRLDGEVARARTEHNDDHWHGWRPSDDGAAPIAKDEPMVVLVHGIVRPRHLTTFLRDNLHALRVGRSFGGGSPRGAKGGLPARRWSLRQSLGTARSRGEYAARGRRTGPRTMVFTARSAGDTSRLGGLTRIG